MFRVTCFAFGVLLSSCARQTPITPPTFPKTAIRIVTQDQQKQWIFIGFSAAEVSAWTYELCKEACFVDVIDVTDKTKPQP